MLYLGRLNGGNKPNAELARMYREDTQQAADVELGHRRPQLRCQIESCDYQLTRTDSSHVKGSHRPQSSAYRIRGRDWMPAGVAQRRGASRQELHRSCPLHFLIFFCCEVKTLMSRMFFSLHANGGGAWGRQRSVQRGTRNFNSIPSRSPLLAWWDSLVDHDPGTR